MKESKKLFTYCWLDTKNSSEKNKVVKIGCNEINDWKSEYINWFLKRYICLYDDPIKVKSVYCDPDITYKKDYNHYFFEQMVKFLNKREDNLKEKLNNHYIYKFEEGKGIGVSEANQKGEKKFLFYLRSDQLGFSAPTMKKSHPYDLYITKSENKYDAVQQVADWVIKSRTIGGSFLWPIPFYDYYNLNRGGKITSTRRYYIQDRADLTLMEIYYWYNKNKKSTIMTRVRDEKAKEVLKKWLSHFKDFETYIEFFCFEGFVSKEKSIKSANLRPINILTSKNEEPKWGEQGENPKIEITSDLEFTTIEEMLKGLNEKILNRSKKMEQIIASKCNKNSKTK